MMKRFGICLVLVSLLGACSAVPERYAPWRDNDATTVGHKPNLGDVPPAPNVTDVKAQMEEMRQRLETERNNAYQAAQGIQGGNPTDPNAPLAPVSQTNLGVTDSDLAPPAPAGSYSPQSSTTTTNSDIVSSNLPALAPDTNQNTRMMAGNVYYNYDPNVGNEYNYGYSAPVTGGDAVSVGSPDNNNVLMASSDNAAVSSDPSVAIDMSVLGNGGRGSSTARRNYTPGQGGITTGAPIAYFAHGSAKLGPKDRTAIHQLVAQLKKRPQAVMLAGNSSRRTGINNTALSREINLKVSERRANAVMDEMVKQGISPEQIFISAYGDSVPNRREEDGHNEAANRRVEIIFDR